MSHFLAREKLRYLEFKPTSPYFSPAALADGDYKGKPRPFCLPDDLAEENLVPEIRQTALAHFAKHRIKWHDGQNGKPSNHLCDSQVCCVNFLYPFAHRPDELARVLRPYFPKLQQMHVVEDGHFVSFEWIGADNYLKEKISRNGQRTRGANFTSADAIVKFKRTDGKTQVVLIEWKYTESYSGGSLLVSKSGTSRLGIYQHLFDQPNGPLALDQLGAYDEFFVEPFYQFMRQQYLAHEMQRAHELEADVVSVLHIAPAHNEDFRRITSLPLARHGDSATGVWTKLVQPEGNFISVSTEALFGGLSEAQLPTMRAWLDYIGARYAWVRDVSRS